MSRKSGKGASRKRKSWPEESEIKGRGMQISTKGGRLQSKRKNSVTRKRTEGS